MRLWALAGWKRLLVTAICLLAWRALEQIALPAVNPGQIALRLQSVDTSSLIREIGSGIPLTSFSLVALGLQPYVNALLVITVIQVISARVRTLARSPEGRLRLRRWTRALAALLAFGQAYGWTVLEQTGSVLPVLPPMDLYARLAVVLELTAGTMILVLLGEVLDDFGLGFGNGALLIYALSPLAIEVHRLPALVASVSPLKAIYPAFGVWVIFSVGVVVLSVAVLLAVRRIPRPERKKSSQSRPVDVALLMSGVIRPPLFANAILFVPVFVANYLTQRNPTGFVWFAVHLTAYGPNPWTDTAYAIIDISLVIGFTYFVVMCDFGGSEPVLLAHGKRLAFIGGVFLALTVVVLPILEWNASKAAGMVIPMSGLDAVLVAAMIVLIARSLQREAGKFSGPPALASRVP
jgi:preprotein translocase subunit SecY